MVRRCVQLLQCALKAYVGFVELGHPSRANESRILHDAVPYAPTVDCGARQLVAEQELALTDVGEPHLGKTQKYRIVVAEMPEPISLNGAHGIATLLLSERVTQEPRAAKCGERTNKSAARPATSAAVTLSNTRHYTRRSVNDV